MSLFERCVTEGNDRVDELTRHGAVCDGEEMDKSEPAQFIRKETEVYAALQYAAILHC